MASWYFAVMGTGKDIAPKVQQFDIGNWQSMADAAQAWAKETHRNVYAPLAVLKKGISSRGKMPDYSHVLGVCADFDDDNAADYLNRLPLSPGMVIGSSKGRFQCVFLFNSPIDTNAAKPIAEALQAHAGCDGCSKDVIHVWRVAGCLNWPNQKKVREGRSPEPQQVTIVQDWCGKAISADALKSAMPVLTHEKKQPATAHTAPRKLTLNDYPPTTKGEVREALSFIRPDLPYDEWVKVLAALHDAGYDDLAHDWSATSSQYDPAEVDKKLASFTGCGITIATIFHYAKEGGYKHAGSTHYPTDKTDITDKRPWNTSIPLARVDIPKVLDLRLMPGCLADIVGNVADATQAPRALAWGVAMAVLATAIGRRAKVELPTHKEPSPLWPCCILPPGSRKSGVFAIMAKPLSDIEALRKALQEQGSIGLLSAEGSSLLESFGRYNGGNKGSDMALFLAAHAGDADKGGRVSGTHGVREAIASMGITAQPDVLQSIGMARGRGLIDRFIFLIPDDPRGSRTYRNQPKLSPAIEKKWAAMIRYIMDLETQETIPCVGVDETAADAWLDFAQDIENRQKPGGDLRGMAGFASKLAGAVGRIALAYHFAQGQDDSSPIDAATMLQAIGTGIAMIDHAKAAMQMMGEDEK